MNIKKTKKLYKEERKEVKARYKERKRIDKAEYKRRRSELSELYLSDVERAHVENGKRPPINPPKRAIIEEIGNAVTHGLGALFSVAAFVLMLMYSENSVEAVGATVYFSGAFIMFSMSCLYHSFPHGSCVKRIFRRFDYSSIYLLIGATFAPVLLCFVGGASGLVFFVVQWAVIITGITLIGVFGPSRLKYIHIPLYVLLGWSAIILMPRMLRGSEQMFFFVLAGGVIYSLGLIPFAIKAKISHFIWHFFVLAGALIQWVGIFRCIYFN